MTLFALGVSLGALSFALWSLWRRRLAWFSLAVSLGALVLASIMLWLG